MRIIVFLMINILYNNTTKTSLIDHIFGGFISYELKCLECSNTSLGYDYIKQLSLTIDDNTNSINDAIQLFTKLEKLNENEKWECNNCKCKVQSTKQFTFYKLPNVIILTLKRFHNINKKISKHIHFDLIQLFQSQNKLFKYNLTGIIVHFSNTTNFGHYKAYVKAPNNSNKWFEMDDSLVTPYDIKDLLKLQAYILFYSRDVSNERISNVVNIQNMKTNKNMNTNLNTNTKTNINTNINTDINTQYLKSNSSNIKNNIELYSHMKRILDFEKSENNKLRKHKKPKILEINEIESTEESQIGKFELFV